jgi:hypothetical protein
MMNGGAAAPVRRNAFPRILAGLSLCANPDWLSTHHTATSIDGRSGEGQSEKNHELFQGFLKSRKITASMAAPVL